MEINCYKFEKFRNVLLCSLRAFLNEKRQIFGVYIKHTNLAVELQLW